MRTRNTCCLAALDWLLSQPDLGGLRSTIDDARPLEVSLRQYDEPAQLVFIEITDRIEEITVECH